MARNFTKLAGAATLAFSALALGGCGERIAATEAAVHLTGYGKNVGVDTTPGLKCWFGCWIGESYIKFSTGQQQISVYGLQPNQKVESPEATASYGVIKVSEGLPLSGNVQLLIRLDITKENEGELKRLYAKIPPRKEESDEQYFDRIMQRLATLGLSEVQDVYGRYSVKDATRTTLMDGERISPVKNIEAQIVSSVQRRFRDSGFGFIKVDGAILTGINLGPQAETANARIAMSSIDQTAAGEQMKAAARVEEAAARMAQITAQEMTILRGAVGEGQDMASIYCQHKTARDPNFKGTGNCFPGARLGK